MIEAKVSTLESLQMNDIQELVRSHGPCITVLLPPYRPGAQAKSMAAILKAKLQETEQQLRGRKISESAISELLEPLEQLTTEAELLEGTQWGRAIFRAPGVLRQVELYEPVSAGVTVGSCFQVRPILAALHFPAVFYILKLSKKRVDLVRCAEFRTEPVPLPRGVPETIDEMLEFRPPDHDLKNRSAAGPSKGTMKGVSFGTGSGRETQHTYLADFYKAVDCGVCSVLNGSNAPLVLSGVDEDVAIYRRVHTYARQMSRTIPAGPGTPLKEFELLQQGYWIVRSDASDRAAAALADSRERLAPNRFSLDVRKILHAAVEGRVERLYLDESAQEVGAFERSPRGARIAWGPEDLLNLAAIETMLHSGMVFALPHGALPERSAAAAVLRY